MNCILIDDERPALDLLEDNAKQIPYLNIIATCRNAIQAIEIIENQPIDLLIMDIQMPGINGVDFLRSLKNPPMVILVTAYAEHAIDGFNLDVVDYLLKPVPFSRFLKAIAKARAHHQLPKNQSLVNAPENDFVFVNANYSLIKVNLQDITFIEGLKDYIKINLKGAPPVITRMGLKGIEEKLGTKRFMRIHKSFIISLDKIQSVQKSQLVIDGIEIPMGDGYRPLLQSYISKRNL